ncbi:AraC family transcriptional regulator [Paenibacillus yanchengensis]|uniref:AraC family transcriptional regulator n=1 Tax=Paenibacillus yanchengensis TaxID=2035833 RepID=A0ABW4YNL7_9BACL
MQDHHYFSVSLNAVPLKKEMSVLFSGEGEPVGRHYIGPAVHDYYLLHIVKSGVGVFETLGTTTICSAGDVFVTFPDILMKYEADAQNPWTYSWVAFSGDVVEEALQSVGITPDQAVIGNCSIETFTLLMKEVRQSLEIELTPELGNMRSAALLRTILYELGAQKARNDIAIGKELQKPVRSASQSFKVVDQAIQMFSLQYGRHLSIETIAHTLGYHRAHLTKLFKEATGMSPQQYLFKVRMKKAEELLLTDLTITQIAASVGYSDPLFFSKQFRKWSGMTPTAFRLQQQQQ